MRKIFNIVRWIFFIPISYIGGCILSWLERYFTPIGMRDWTLSQLTYMLGTAAGFYWIAEKMIPSTPIRKVKIPLWLIFIGNIVPIAMWIMFFAIDITIKDYNNLKIFEKYFYILCGNAILTFAPAYLLCTEKGQNEIEKRAAEIEYQMQEKKDL